MLKKIILVILVFCHAAAFAKPVTLRAIETTLVVHGKQAKVFDIVQPDQTEGMVAKKGDFFDVTLKNETSVPVSIHWHGLILPNDQDGVPYVTQLPIPPGGTHHYYFKILQAGTFWMHSHYEFHEQELMTAPLILTDDHDKYANDKDIVVMFQGFTFKNPETIFHDLQHRKMTNMKMSMSSKPDLNDVEYDAYIANRKTLSDPDIHQVKPGDKIRLRLINGASASNFWIDTGKLDAKAIAADGDEISPIENHRFQLAIAQRLDLEVVIPASGGVFPILAQVEGTKQQTGILLVTKGAKIPQMSEITQDVLPPLNNDQELKLHALSPLAVKPVTTVLNYKLSGEMQGYIWKINNEVWPHIHPLKIKKGDRVEMVFVNNTNMSHPMHLHGHVFQVSEIDGVKLTNGPLRDTILVLPHSTEKIIFDAENPGIWMMHCHVLYHMAAGMMTTTNYQDYPEPEFYKELIK